MDLEDIGCLQEKIIEVKDKLKSFIIQKDSITTYLLGLTGSGKSTFTNYMLGAELKWEKKKGKYQLDNGGDEKFPKIGNTPTSCTDIPSIYCGNGFCFVDPAGFMDTKGPTQETINSFANAKMFVRGAKTRIILVIEQSTLYSARGGNLVDVAVRLHELFPVDFNNLVHSCMILITKANIEDISLEDVSETISQIISSNRNLPPQCQMMISTILQYRRIALFPIPKQMTPEIIEGTKNQVADLRECVLSADATISLSSAAKLKLDEMAANVTDDLKKCSKQIRTQIQIKFDNQHFKTSEQIQPIIGKIKQSISILTNELSEGAMDSFEHFAKYIDLSQQLEGRVKTNYDKIDFCRTLNSEVRTNMNLIENILNALRESLGRLEAEYQKRATKEQIDQMNKKHDEAMASRKKQFDTMTNTLIEEGKKREQQARQNLAQQRNHLQSLIDQSNKQYQDSMAMMQKQLTELRNRPPQVIHRRSGPCSIM